MIILQIVEIEVTLIIEIIRLVQKIIIILDMVDQDNDKVLLTGVIITTQVIKIEIIVVIIIGETIKTVTGVTMTIDEMLNIGIMITGITIITIDTTITVGIIVLIVQQVIDAIGIVINQMATKDEILMSLK
jgi:hypothetical protein